MRHARHALLALAALAPLGCKEFTMGLRVVAADGGDPFLPPDAATEARFRVEDDSVAPVTAAVSPSGYFALEVPITRAPRPTRGFVEALRMGQVVGGGATPPVNWLGLGPSVLQVFVQRRDSVVEYPWALRSPRAAPLLMEVAPTFVTAVGGTGSTAPVESYNELTLQGASDGAMWDPAFGRETSFLRLVDGRVLAVRGCAALVWNPASAEAPTMPMAMPPPERCDITGSTAVQEPGGGGVLLGGRRAAGAVPRVDVVMPDGTWAAALPMAAPRARPAAVRTGPYEALVGGGQEPGAPFLERYTRTLEPARRPLRTGMPRVDDRTNAALVALDGGAVLALGGTVLGSTDLAAEDVVLDARCLEGGCPLVVATPRLLAERRRDPVAVLAEEGRVVVASGAGAGGVAASVEVVDASDPRRPVAVGAVGSLPFDNLSALRLATGAVLFAGGGTMRTWVYRH